MTVVFLNGMNLSEKNSALCDYITAGLGLKQNILTAVLLPFGKKRIQLFLKCLDIKLLFIRKLMIRSTETSAEIQELEFIEFFGIVKEVPAGLKERLIIHKKGTDMLVQSDNMQIILRGYIADLLNICSCHTELGFLSCSYDFFVMTGSDAGINTYGESSTRIEFPEHLKLRKAVDAYNNTFIDGILHLFFGNVI